MNVTANFESAISHGVGTREFSARELCRVGITDANDGVGGEVIPGLDRDAAAIDGKGDGVRRR